jgi:rubrerythrin
MGPDDPGKFVNSLQKKFTLDDLYATGYLTPPGDSANAVQLHGNLSCPNRAWVALRSSNGDCFNILGDHGLVASHRPALLELARDKAFRLAADKCRNCFLVFNLDDFLVLSSLGVPVAPAHGLEQLGKAALTEFRQLLGQETRDTSQPGLETPPRIEALTVVSCHLARFELAQPPTLSPLVTHLVKLHQHLGTNLAATSIWTPSSEAMDAIQFAVRYCGKRSSVAALIAKEVQKHRVPIVETLPAIEETLGETYEQFLLAVADEQSVKTQLQQHKLERGLASFIARLITEAEAVDIMQGNLQVLIAPLLHEAHVRLLDRIARRASRRSTDRIDWDSAELKEIMELLKPVTNLSRRANSWSPNSRPTMPEQSFPHS